MDYLEIEDAGTRKKIRYRADIPNIRDFVGRAGLPWLIMAANVNLSINELLTVMAHYDVVRTRSWVSRRRWIFFDAGYVRSSGASADADGQQARAYRIMEQHPKISARDMVRILSDNGIKRGRDWVLKHRCL
jgi:hypothetical protein